MHNDKWVQLLETMGCAVRDAVVDSRNKGEDLATPVAQQAGDTIFAVDRHVETVLHEQIQAWPDECKPLMLVAEGLGTDGCKRFGDARQPVRYRVIVDPIDGTRNIMYDKRSAWFLAAVAENRNETVCLSDTFVSVMVEIPTSKQNLADVFSAVKGQIARGKRMRLADGYSRSALIAPSTAQTLLNGFAQVSNFFPGTKVLASTLMEKIVVSTLGQTQPGHATVFDDQYITTGGQMVELITGRDRFCCDLRPLFYQILEKESGRSIRGLEAHPYDVAGMLVAQQSGVVLTDGLGKPLDAPFDVLSPVHWCGYANDGLRKAIEPVIQNFFAKHNIYNHEQ